MEIIKNLDGAHNGAINLEKADVGGSFCEIYNRWIATTQNSGCLNNPP